MLQYNQVRQRAFGCIIPDYNVFGKQMTKTLDFNITLSS